MKEEEEEKENGKVKGKKVKEIKNIQKQPIKKDK